MIVEINEKHIINRIPDTIELRPKFNINKFSKLGYKFSLDDPWKVSYKRQMDMYVWVARNKGFNVSNASYFVYVDAQHKGIGGMLNDAEPSKACMEFETSIIAYEADPTWVEPTLLVIKHFLDNQEICPNHTPKGENYEGCDNGRYFDEVKAALVKNYDK